MENITKDDEQRNYVAAQQDAHSAAYSNKSVSEFLYPEQSTISIIINNK